MLSGIHHLLIHWIATISYTRFPPFKTEMRELYAVLSHLQTYTVARVAAVRFSPVQGHISLNLEPEPEPE